ncbi:type I DNA topoisomerase, partial [Candidatus Curtissbacteria bacterium]|nr:type I DNA topoisomerase [Candidatus Curtissbacteria bacterium]
RVVFHEITRDAVAAAFEHSRKIDEDLVGAQQARRVLDRVVGYKLSPLLWKKVKSGLSAGRVQSVALRLVVEREREIEAHIRQEYWEIWVEVTRATNGSKGTKDTSAFLAKLIKIKDKKAEIKNKGAADKIVSDLKESQYKVGEIKARDVRKYPNPPFTTSTLQQSAANRLGFTPSRTMRVAQDLYERGLITYMRTDSVNLSQPAVVQVRKFVKDKFGQNYLPANPRKYKAKSRLVQEAHEAIRPTNIELTADMLAAASSDQKKLYDLIWRRMVVCQMAEAVVSERSIDVLTKDGKSYLLRATGQKIKFDGWYKIYEKAPIKEQELPELAKDDPLTLIRIDSQQKFTEPPPRFTEATLIRELEKNDIGRPSTYAPTISTLYERAYIEKVEGKKIAPTPIGKTTVDFLVKNFGEIVDVSFTAEMENNLDLIAQGEADLVGTMEKFWGPFDAQVQKVAEEAEKMKVQVEETDEKCEVCGKPMVIRYGRYGKFLACSGFPECKNTKALVFETGLTCPQDGGNIVVKRTKKGKTFWGCANWPKCKFASWQKPPSAASEGEPSQVTA